MSDYLNFSIQTKKDFKNWIFRQLGYPFINPEIRDENLEDCINDAVEEYRRICCSRSKIFCIEFKRLYWWKRILYAGRSTSSN